MNEYNLTGEATERATDASFIVTPPPVALTRTLLNVMKRP